MDISRKPSHRAKSRSKAHILRAEPSVTADAVAVPANLPGARNGALDIGDNPQPHPGEILRLHGLAETQILPHTFPLPSPPSHILFSIHLSSFTLLFLTIFFFSFCSLFSSFSLTQKTAYEMRIRDWSSDVCSSDLSKAHILRAEPAVTADAVAVPANLPGARNGALDIGDNPQRHAGEILRLQGLAETRILHQKVRLPCPAAQIMGDIHLHNPRPRAWLDQRSQGRDPLPRSEEHTSELQSLMSNSYAV